MSQILSYRGRAVTAADITLIRNTIAAHPDDSRRALSRRICQAWDWTQHNGQLKDMVCRGLLLHLERQGHIIQPPPKCKIGQYRRKRPESVEIDTAPINVPLKEIRSLLRFEQVRRTPHEKLFNSLIEHYHYLTYAQPVGEHLKYIVFCEQRPLACLAFSSAANWQYLGRTKGRGKYNKTQKQLTSIKDIYGLPLDSRFRDKLCL